ncbi:hypothetical protein [Streptomyces sp. NPDC004008]
MSAPMCWLTACWVRGKLAAIWPAGGLDEPQDLSVRVGEMNPGIAPGGGRSGRRPCERSGWTVGG